jgi:hypothetical protein
MFRCRLKNSAQPLPYGETVQYGNVRRPARANLCNIGAYLTEPYNAIRFRELKIR